MQDLTKIIAIYPKEIPFKNRGILPLCKPFSSQPKLTL
jgi:hypothetical protein